ncbi:MAG TPA: tetratricopeptide repeat protein [Planctomycetota bacterium]
MRLVAFFALAFVLASVLGHLPLIGPLFRGTGILGLFLAAGLASALLTSVGARLVAARRLRSELAALGAVDSPRNRGKMGSLYLMRGRPRAAVAPLEEAARGEPEVAEWHYRLGLARLAIGALEPALAAFEHCVTLEEEHAYGAAMLRRAECLARLGRMEEALAVLATFERNHGPSPESAYRRGRAARALGRKAEARAAFAEAVELARRATRYQRRAASGWALRASVARWL